MIRNYLYYVSLNSFKTYLKNIVIVKLYYLHLTFPLQSNTNESVYVKLGTKQSQVKRLIELKQV